MSYGCSLRRVRLQVTARVPPKWSVILRPPTDKTCKEAIKDASHPLVVSGSCPTETRRDAIIWKDRRSHAIHTYDGYTYDGYTYYGRTVAPTLYSL